LQSLQSSYETEIQHIGTALDSKADLDSDGKVLSSQLPSYVDDVLEYDTLDEFPEEGESGKIYVALDTNLTYRWSGTTYIEISPSLALGETSSTAYAGDKGAANKAALDSLPSEIVTSVVKAGSSTTYNSIGVGYAQKDSNNQYPLGASRTI